MALKKRGEMNESIEFYLGEILESQRESRAESKALSESVILYGAQLRETREDVDVLKEVVGTDGRNGLVMEMRDFRAEMKAQIQELDRSIDIALNNEVVQQRDNKSVIDWERLGIDWAKIGKIVFGFLAAAGYWFGIN